MSHFHRRYIVSVLIKPTHWSKRPLYFSPQNFEKKNFLHTIDRKILNYERSLQFQMALDSKTIKEEILDKDIYEANAIRAKGECNKTHHT